MKRLAWLLVGLIVAACGPVIITPGPIGPAEIARYSDAATNTAAAAAVQATQDAHIAALATAAGLSARETSTAAALGTLGALAAQQTQVALQLTTGAGAALATDAAALRTQAAIATARAATPTAAAVRTQAAIVATEVSRRAANGLSVAEFWRSFRFIVLALIVVGGLTAIVVVAIDRVTAVHIARLGQRAIIAREAFRILAPGHWAEWVPDEGYQVYELPGALDEPAMIIENAVSQPDKVHGLKQAARLFTWWGEKFGFGIRDLGPAGAKVVTDPAYRRLAGMLRDLAVLGDVVIDGQTKTGWLEGYNYTRFADELSKGRLVLPPLAEDEDVPKVLFTVPTQHRG